MSVFSEIRCQKNTCKYGFSSCFWLNIRTCSKKLRTQPNIDIINRNYFGGSRRHFRVRKYAEDWKNGNNHSKSPRTDDAVSRQSRDRHEPRAGNTPRLLDSTLEEYR